MTSAQDGMAAGLLDPSAAMHEERHVTWAEVGTRTGSSRAWSAAALQAVPVLGGTAAAAGGGEQRNRQC
ncbi:hypothetical protein [Streptomyces shenzhenensis]|uniref:hypothetical protein n=1 Tax=Streptomyces shenzhenensis TaxID=943815 RepID=UPI0015F01256|nr:hypothetical protein [Streptomyces shenzhenensis]